jgi:hypothetical protein
MRLLTVSQWIFTLGNILVKTHCNLSATASTDSYGGLFFDREPQQLWVDEIELKTEGVTYFLT